ncbi:hypothetical protein BYT27DRAFT_6945891 [Phlegmacium glaucopus]|nr:hypothetical protein BYT27DRAFT_6945891 [Phlegmacium glaucopus]
MENHWIRCGRSHFTLLLITDSRQRWRPNRLKEQWTMKWVSFWVIGRFVRFIRTVNLCFHPSGSQILMYQPRSFVMLCLCKLPWFFLGLLIIRDFDSLCDLQGFKR